MTPLSSRRSSRIVPKAPSGRERWPSFGRRWGWPPGRCVGGGGGEPGAVGGGDHVVVVALPDGDGGSRCLQVVGGEAPGVDEGEVVVAPAGEAGCEGGAEC